MLECNTALDMTTELEYLCGALRSKFKEDLIRHGDTHDFRPLHFDEVSKRMALKTEAALERHQDDTVGESRSGPRDS